MPGHTLRGHTVIVVGRAEEKPIADLDGLQAPHVIAVPDRQSQLSSGLHGLQGGNRLVNGHSTACIGHAVRVPGRRD